MAPSNPSLPKAYLERMQALLGDEFQEFLEIHDAPVSTGLRVNTLKVNPSVFQRLSPYSLSPVQWCPTGFYVEGEAQPGKHPYHSAGLYYLQEPSAMLAAEALSPKPGERVLDLAAAPGGKSTHLAAKMQNQGLLVANEIHPRRVWELAENIERWGATNVVITNETPERLADHFGPYFDRVLLDAPCSGEGMFRKSEIARQDWNPTLVHSCAIRQLRILDQAGRLVRSGGVLLYATCTFSPEENEGVIADFLNRQPGFGLENITHYPGFAPGRPDWLQILTVEGKQSTVNQATRLWPHKVRGEGHFIALMRRIDSGQDAQLHQWDDLKIPRQVKQVWEEFNYTQLLSHEFSEPLFYRGSYLYKRPLELPDMRSLRVVHPGLWLGTAKKKRFQPAHPLALAMRANQAAHQIYFSAGDERLLSYLKGESFPSEGEDGWALVCIDSFPLGWGKRVKGTLKNYYPHGLRWQSVI
jgi:NOL1/NOP2/sun family putative RNA methylase